MNTRLVVSAITLLLLCTALSAQDTPTGKPKDREKAIKNLAKQGAPGISGIRPYLKDPDRGVRIEAVKAIVGIATQESLDPLVEATRDNDAEVQIRAVEGLVNFYLPGYVQRGFTSSFKRAGSAIKGKFTDTNDEVIEAYIVVRPEVIQAIGKVASGGTSMDARATAARAAGVLRGRSAVPDLLATLKSKDSRVIYEALIAFQKIKDPSVGPQIQYLLSDFDEKIQITAIETTGLLRNRDALPTLTGMLDRSRSSKLQKAALSAIAMLPDPANRTLLLGYLTNSDEDFRAAAAEGLGRILDPQDQVEVQKAYDSEGKTSARLSMAFALVMLGQKEQSEFSPLQYLVNTLNSSSHMGVAQALLTEAARDSHVLTVLNRMILTGTKDEKMYLAQVLAVSGDKSSVEPLEALSRDPETEVAQASLRALQTLKSRLP